MTKTLPEAYPIQLGLEQLMNEVQELSDRQTFNMGTLTINQGHHPIRGPVWYVTGMASEGVVLSQFEPRMK